MNQTDQQQPRRVLTLDEIGKRIDRQADTWLAGREVRSDPDLEHSLEAHGLTIWEAVLLCDGRRRST